MNANPLATASARQPAVDSTRLLRHLQLAAVLALGAALRVAGAQESLWVDELHTSWVVGAGLSELVERAAFGNQSPLYFFLPWLSIRLYGLSELALRLPSLAAGLLLLGVLYRLLRDWTGSHAAGLLAALLAAIDGNFIFYAQEARPYAVLQVLSLCHVALLYHLPRRPTSTRRAALVVVGALLFHLQYTSVLLLVAELAWLAWAMRRRDNIYRMRQLTLDAALLILLMLPAASHLALVFSRRSNWTHFIQQPKMWDLVTIYPITGQLLVPLAVLAVAVGLHRWLAASRHPATRRLRRGQLVLVACWLLLPPLAAWTLTRTDVVRVFLYRYLIASATASPVAAALLLHACRSQFARGVMIAGAVGLTAWTTYSPLALFPLEPRQENWRAATAMVRRADPAGRLPVLVRSGLIEADGLRGDPSPQLRAYCLAPINTLYTLPDHDIQLPLPTTHAGQLNAEQIAALRRYEGGWLLLRGRPLAARRIADQALVTLDGAGLPARIAQHKSFGNLSLFRIQLAAAR